MDIDRVGQLDEDFNNHDFKVVLKRVLIRLPILIAVDYIFSNINTIIDYFDKRFDSIDTIAVYFLIRFFYVAVVCSALFMFILSETHLISLYLFIVLLLLPNLNELIIKNMKEKVETTHVLDQDDAIYTQILSLITTKSLILRVFVYFSINISTISILNKLFNNKFYIYTLPVVPIYQMACLNQDDIRIIQANYLNSTLLTVFLLFNSISLKSQLTRIIGELSRYFKVYGIFPIIRFYWYYLHVPSLFRLYFFYKFFAFLIKYEFFDEVNVEYVDLDKDLSETIITNAQIVVHLSKFLLFISSTYISILSLTSVISYVYYLISLAIHRCIFAKSNVRHATAPVGNNNVGNNNRNNNNNHRNQDDEDLLDLNEISTILFILLNIQSDITGLYKLKRLFKLIKNIILLFIAILHYIHRIIDKQLIKLSVSSTQYRFLNHIRILTIGVFLLLLIPISILSYIFTSQYIKYSTWFIAVSCFNIELIIKYVLTLVLYALHIWDLKRLNTIYKSPTSNDQHNAKNGSSNSTSGIVIDDYVYYIKLFGNFIEFIFSLILFVNSIFILLYESYGSIRIIMIILHVYYHLWLKLYNLYMEFVKRYKAMSKIKQLRIYRPHVNEEGMIESGGEEEERDEVCAICYSSVTGLSTDDEARVTVCNHIFHSICLRKWLYIQDNCPLCHSIVYPKDTQSAVPNQK